MQRVSEIPAGIAAIQLQPLVVALEQLGHAPARVFARAGLSAADLADPYARLPLNAELAVWDAIAELGDPLIALGLAERIETGALGGLEYLMRSSATLRAALESAQRFERVVNDLSRLELIEQGERTAVRLWREGGYPHPERGVECLFAALVKAGERELSGSFQVEVCFKHRCAGDPVQFAARLRHPVRFEQPHDELLLPTALLDRPLRSADPRLGAVLEDHLRRVLEEVPALDPFLVRVRGRLGPLLERGEASLPALARALQIGARTLRRRLEEHGTSYKALLDDVRRDRAEHYVGDTSEPFEEVARRLGFSDRSTFYRAFKRWAGTTPALYRARKT